MSIVLSAKSVKVRIDRISADAQPGEVFPIVAERSGPFFLDSGGDRRGLAQWSFLGSDPFLTVSARGDSVTERGASGTSRSRGNPFEGLRRILRRYAMEPAAGAPPFSGGAVGFFGYDLKRFIEKLPARAKRDCRIPDMHFSLYDSFLAYDHASGDWLAVALEGLGGKTPSGRTVTSELARLSRLVEGATATGGISARRAFEGEIGSNFTRDEYIRTVRRALEYIAAGDIFQVNLSQRFEARLVAAPDELYQRLRRINPAPFAAFIAGDGWAVAGSSPERFMLLRDRHVWTRPIKGTRKRTGDPKEDEALRRELLSSSKDRAELVMIVDLERNDLGRVCDYGSVRVTEPVVLEEHPTVHHLVATVEGDLHAGYAAIDLIKASFPGGSITGAPKVRAMEIIDELEPTARNLYTGSVGYIGFDGGMDTNIVIRTFLVERSRVTFQVGGGIVADSAPQAEYEETLDKGRALLEALGPGGKWVP